VRPPRPIARCARTFGLTATDLIRGSRRVVLAARTAAETVTVMGLGFPAHRPGAVLGLPGMCILRALPSRRAARQAHGLDPQRLARRLLPKSE